MVWPLSETAKSARMWCHFLLHFEAPGYEQDLQSLLQVWNWEVLVHLSYSPDFLQFNTYCFLR